MKVLRIAFLSISFMIMSICQINAQCTLSNLNVTKICCDGSGGLQVIGSFTVAKGSGNYSVNIDPASNAHFQPPQAVNIPPSAVKNGKVNFNVTFKKFDYKEIGSGISILDSSNYCSSPAGPVSDIPTSAAKCKNCKNP